MSSMLDTGYKKRNLGIGEWEKIDPGYWILDVGCKI
jgi:hypothetical protein